MPINNSGLSKDSLLKSSPSCHGDVQKLHIPLFYLVAPLCMQRFVLSSRLLHMFCPSSFKPSWKSRYLVSIGKYVYKFNQDSSSSEPKGAPISIESVNAKLMSSPEKSRLNSAIDYYINDSESLQSNIPGWEGFFSVTTCGKTRYYAVKTEEEAILWINTLQEGRHEVIKRNMGHSNEVPYPTAWTYLDKLGDSFLKHKERVRSKMTEMEARDIEMSAMGDGALCGGRLNSGFYT